MSKLKHQIRIKVRQRAKNRCEICNRKGSKHNILTTHHIRPKAFGGENKEDNLMCVCEECHREIHNYINTQLHKHRKPDMGLFKEAINYVKIKKNEFSKWKVD